MLTYPEMVEWTRLFDLVANRVGVFNQIMGCRYAHSADNPMLLKKCKKRYEIYYDGSLVCSFGVWDVEGTRSVCETISSWVDCAWQLAGSGRLVSA